MGIGYVGCVSGGISMELVWISFVLFGGGLKKASRVLFDILAVIRD